MPLKELDVRHAKPRDKPYKLADGDGLYLFVKPNGARLWRLKYRVDGKEKLLSFGGYPEMTLAAAREKRFFARKMLAEGRDPMAEKAKARKLTDNTFEVVARLWHANRENSLDSAHAGRVLSRMERDVFPAIGSRPITNIKGPDVLAMVRQIEARGALDISRRAKQCVGQVFRFAIANGWAEHDPSSHLEGALKPRPRVEHMSRIRTSELPTFLTKLANYDGEAPRRRMITRNAIKFTLLTWVRTKEVRFALPSEFEGLDGKEPVWRVPAERMKKKREHLIPLSLQAANIAREMIASADGGYLFAGEKPLKPISENTMIFALYRMGYIGKQTVHGFRGLASTWANDSLMPDADPLRPARRYHEDWVEMQLAHVGEDDVRRAYNAAEYIVPRRQMLQDWADFLTDMEQLEVAA